MSDVRLPPLLRRPKAINEARDCPAHRAWVRKHKCSVPACGQLPIECAHVRRHTDGGMGLKSSDAWCISLCSYHHAEQHRFGELSFETRYGLDLITLALAFARRSPHWRAFGSVS